MNDAANHSANHQGVPVQTVIARAILGLAVNVVLIALFCATAWEVSSPYQGEIRQFIVSLPSKSVTLVSLCAVLGYMALHILSVGAAISTGLWDLLESRFRRTPQR